MWSLSELWGTWGLLGRHHPGGLEEVWEGCLPALAFPGHEDHPRSEHGGDWVFDARANGRVSAFSRPWGPG